MADDNEDFTERTISFRAAMAQVPSAQAEVPAHLLLVLADNAPPRHVPLQVLPLTIGRTLPSDLLLDGSTVSRRHCQLVRQGDRIVLTALGSPNGYFVHG